MVYSKDNVAIHPNQHLLHRITGLLRLIKHDSSLLLSWIPYQETSNQSLTEKDRNLYTISDVPFTDVRSIRQQNPTIGLQYIIVVLSSGLAFPPLYFYNGGTREFLANLKQQIVLTRSTDDANVFLVNDLRDPLQKSLSSLELPRALSVANGTSRPIISAPLNEPLESIEGSSYDGASSTYQYSEKHRNKSRGSSRDRSIHVLEKFSIVTKFARETTSHIFRESNNDVKDKKSQRQSYQVNAPEIKSSDRQKDLDKISTTVDFEEVDKVTLAGAKPHQPPLRYVEWASFLDGEGRIMNLDAFMKRIFYGEVDHKLRKVVWKFLLGYHKHDSTYVEREEQYLIRKLDYETLKRQWQSISPAQAKKFTKFRERKSLIEKDVVRTDRSVPFYEGDDSPNLILLRDILVTYSFYNFDLGYCQGMNDLLSPILYVMNDEVDSFWCFVALMERLGPNFDQDQNGMHSQLFALLKLVELLDSPLHNYFEQNDCLNYFFCFRWILLQFKREFEYEKTMRLWEVFWTRYLSEHLHLYACVAILKRHSKKIMEEEMDFDNLLKFINELSGHIDVNETLRDAEALCITAGENGEACIPPGTPPSLPTETSSVYSQQDDI